MDLQGKKILIFGGPALSADIVFAAKSMGLYTIVTDWHKVEDSYAKQVADEHWEVSLDNSEELSRRIKEYGIDGVITGFADSYLLYYQHLCEICGLPCYATRERFETTLDKAKFKELCRQYNVPTVPEFKLEDFDKTTIDSNHSILFKPVDNSGSRGICKCDNPTEFDDKLKYALSFSQKKQVVIERYMDCEDVSFEYKIQDGEIVLSSICDRSIYITSSGSSVTSGLLYPSKYLDRYVREVDAKVQSMFRGIGLKNGVLFLQAFVDDESFYFYEMGYRLSGGRHYLFTENQNGTNACKELVHFAITGDMADYRLKERCNPYFPQLCYQLSVLCKNETIGSIEGWEKVQGMDGVIDASKYYSVGDVVGAEGTSASIFAKIHIVSENAEKLSDSIADIFDVLQIRNELGQSIVTNAER